MTNGPVEIFFNASEAATKEYPAMAGRPLGLSGTLFIEVQPVEALYQELRENPS